MSGNTPVPSEDISNWINAVEAYVKGTNASCLDLRWLPISVETVLSVLKLLAQSQITELLLDGIDLSGGMKTFREYIKSTNVKKLSIYNCNLFPSELVDLAEVLNDTKIVELHVSSSGTQILINRTAGKKLASYLQLKKLRLNTGALGMGGILLLAEGLPSNSLTSLHIVGSVKSADIITALACLFSMLPHCRITDLNLFNNSLNNRSMRDLSRHLPASKIKKLSLAANHITDTGLDILAQGLVNSDVTELDLSGNRIHGWNDFGHYLQKSKIRILNFSENTITSGRMFQADFLKESSLDELDLCWCKVSDEIVSGLIRGLRSTKLKKLDLQCNDLWHQSIAEFASVLKDTILEDVSLSWTDSLPPERLDSLSGCFKESRLKHIRLNRPTTSASCLRFLKGIKDSPVLISVAMRDIDFIANNAELSVEAFRNSTFTHLNLYQCVLTNIFSSLVLNLKFTSITHLNLSACQIDDEKVQLLAEHLNETKIVDLDLSFNRITNIGAEALAECCPQTSLIHLNLSGNKIEKERLEILAKRFAGSLITTLEVRKYASKEFRFLPIEKMLLDNQVQSHKLLAFFNRVFPQSSDGNFCFYQCVNDSNIQEFLEECLQFHKRASEQPAVVNVILKETSLFSREEVVSLLFDKFPRQLVEFIESSIEADVLQLVKFLKRAEELGLVRIVECLLVSRPLFMIDVAESILHPDVYGLLVKYEQPICNEAIEPGGVERIKEYFTAHSDLEGAEHVINLLSSNEQKPNTQGPDCKRFKSN